jgi:flagellar biosynthesis protein FlhG
VITIASGKGGVGKTVTTVNLAVAARRAGLATLIVDGDLGLANVDVLMGVSPRFSVRDVLDGHVGLGEIVVHGPLGIDLIPSGSGIASLTRLTLAQRQVLLDQIAGLDWAYDLVLIDAGAGIGDCVTAFATGADRTVVVTTPEPHAMTDAYALIKVLAEDHGLRQVDLLVNQGRAAGEGLKVAERIAEVARRFLNVQVQHLGSVPFDPQVTKAVMARRAATEQSAHTLAGQAWAEASRRLFGTPVRAKDPGSNGMREFFEHLLDTRATSPSATLGV